MTRHNSYIGREWRRGRQLLPPGGNSDAGTSFEGMSGVLRRSKRGNLIKFKLIDFFQLHWHLDKFYENRTPNSAELPASVGHFFEDEIKTFLAKETDEDRRLLKTGFCDWFWKWELVDTGVSDLKKQVNILVASA